MPTFDELMQEAIELKVKEEVAGLRDALGEAFSTIRDAVNRHYFERSLANPFGGMSREMDQEISDLQNKLLNYASVDIRKKAAATVQRNLIAAMSGKDL